MDRWITEGGIGPAMSDDLRLNSLDRFSKQSTRLVLEEHGHCEVPAGCGGVVLRWRNPSAGQPALLEAALTGQIELFIDGRACPTSRVTLPPGEHVLAARLSELSEPRLFAFAARHDSDDYATRRRSIASLLSADDRTWRATATPPAEDWLHLGFDDASWPPIEAIEDDLAQVDEARRWRFQRLVEMGAALLILPNGEQLWLRKRFHIAP